MFKQLNAIPTSENECLRTVGGNKSLPKFQESWIMKYDLTPTSEEDFAWVRYFECISCFLFQHANLLYIRSEDNKNLAFIPCVINSAMFFISTHYWITWCVTSTRETNCLKSKGGNKSLFKIAKVLNKETLYNLDFIGSSKQPNWKFS